MPSDQARATAEYRMEFLSDSYLMPASPGDPEYTDSGVKLQYYSTKALAYYYGKCVHLMLSGNANGKSITTELRNIPSEPMGTVYLQAAGTVGRFRANGTTFAFDSQGLIAGCDAMLDGGVGLVSGASGADWFPMMVPAANLATVTPTTSNSPALANTIAAPSGFDPMAPGNIWASFGTAGVEGDVYAVQLDRPHAVAAATESITRESVSKSLTWLLETPYNATPVVISLTSVSVAAATFMAGPTEQLFAGSGSGMISTLSGSFTPLGLLAGSGSGLVATLSSSITTLTTGTRATGTAAPLLGASAATIYTGWTNVVNSYADDEYIEVGGWAFTISIAGNAYGGCFASSNNYVTFGSGSLDYNNLSATNPALPKVHVGSTDGAYLKVYTQKTSNVVRVRIESSQYNYSFDIDRVTEIAFWKPTGSTQLIEIRTGDFSGVSVPFMIASASTSYASATTLGANQSWVFEGNAAGTSWTLYENSYVVT